ncbi:hypothetical protein IFM89_014020 [Coptis chinensis]|uniref:Peptidase S8/S53 domain-containing protein n=1 Tax=Coptis chinensis TaxID=261450 RepID=A0A835I7N7_9MAGN|nr:hypothetical protein IFM89_014020 [Coptis chinensis]
MKNLNESKYGFWGVLARKAKSILDDENVAHQFNKPALHIPSDDMVILNLPSICNGTTFNSYMACPEGIKSPSIPSIDSPKHRRFKESKVIGARFYNSRGEYDSSDFKSTRDYEGHRSHTASTVGGNVVKGASYYGKGASYYGLAAFDDAIADRVNVISVSLGSEEPQEYFKDPIAIGSFHAMRKGILTSNSAAQIQQETPDHF